MDCYLFQQINNFAGHYQWLDILAIFLASYFQYVLGVGLVIFMLVRKDKAARWKNFKITALAYLSAIVSRFIIGQVLKMTISRPRPSQLHQVTQLIPFDSFGSFPSGHMCFFFALSMVVYFYNKKLGWVLFISSFLMGLARVFCGVHYPLDILGGMILGILVGRGSYKIFFKKI